MTMTTEPIERERVALPKKTYRVELELYTEDIDFVAVSIRLQKLLAPLADVRSGKMSITEIHDDKEI